MDLDNTIAGPKRESYLDCAPNRAVIARMEEYKKLGFQIVIHSSRNMRTYGGNLGLINANTLPDIIAWLKANNVPYDEVWVGKPWCGTEGFYVDDRAIRPAEFVNLELDEIRTLLGDVDGNSPTRFSASG